MDDQKENIKVWSDYFQQLMLEIEVDEEATAKKYELSGMNMEFIKGLTHMDLHHIIKLNKTISRVKMEELDAV